MRVEYLVLIDSAEEFCRSVHSFNNLIQAYENIKIQGDDIFYHGKSFRYEVIYEDIGREHQRYFHIKLTCHNNQSIEQFRELLKSLRTILTKVSGRPPETVWDEISTDLCIKAYPLIHHTENLLRKLITKFMLANIGVGWQKEAIPQEVVDSIKSKSSDRSQNYLYELDFIQLSNLLFKEYSTGDSRKFIEAIAIASEITELNLKELKEIVPRSNWERYFAPIVNCDSNYLKKRWEKLYEFRCKVAHNRFLTPSELTEVQTFTADVNEKFQEALDNLDKVQVTEDQKEEVAINIAATTNNNFAAFLSRWEKLNRTLRNLDNLIAQDDEIEKLNGSKNWRNLVNFGIKKGILSQNYKDRVLDLSVFRNAIVHNPDVFFTDSSVYDRIEKLDQLIEEATQIFNEKSVKDIKT